MRIEHPRRPVPHDSIPSAGDQMAATPDGLS